MVDLMTVLPEYFRPVMEFQQLMKADGAALEDLENNMQHIRQNFYIQTADEKTLAQWEKWFHMIPQPGDTLDYRRQRLLQKYNTIVPFSIEFLRNQLRELFGKEYSMQANPVESTLVISVTSSRYGAVDLLYDLLWDVVPAHVEITANQQVSNYVSMGLYSAGVMSGTFLQTI